MCGIYGTTFHYKDEVLQRKLKRMNFRGPDYSGLKKYQVKDECVSLGHNRLSIIDLDIRSSQPFDFNKSLSIVFNGEIYNYQELKTKYLQEFSFRTSSDTEVLCAMYAKYGMNCLQYLNGMFAFVILDKDREILFGARDRLGKKPFYYYLTEDGIEFCSQISSISIENKFNIDANARSQYLYCNYIADPLTIYEEVKKLEAGHYFVYGLSNRSFKEDVYWDIFYNSSNYVSPTSYDEAKSFIKELLFDSVSKRLNADVPVGVFLSGGIDSSLITSIVSKLNNNINCYTIGFKEKNYDESNYARSVAEHLHIPIEVDYCCAEEALEILRDISYYYDEPFADYSMIPSALVSEKARKHVTVVLGGDGGDELFWGYQWYKTQIQRSWQFSNPIIRYILRSTCGLFDSYKSKSVMFECENVYQAYRYLSKSNYNGAELYNVKSIANSMPNVDLLDSTRGALSFSDFDIKLFMNSDINTKTDRATMRCSLELRSPLMDYRLAEYSRLLPLEYLYSNEYGQKRILKDILYEYVPQEFFVRRKQGFAAPVGAWLKGTLREEFDKIMTSDNLHNFIPELKTESILRQKANFLKGDSSVEINMWRLYAYLKWALS